MDTVIVGENEEVIGLSLIDDDVEHVIDVRKDDGTARTHNQDGYRDDPSEREHRENGNGSQARRHGLYYAYRERGVETLPPHENPDHLAAALLAQVSLDEATFERCSGDLYRCVDNDDYDGFPAPVQPEDFRMYKQAVYPKDHSKRSPAGLRRGLRNHPSTATITMGLSLSRTWSARRSTLPMSSEHWSSHG